MLLTQDLTGWQKTMSRTIVARWYKVTFQMLTSKIQELDVIEFDNDTYCYCDTLMADLQVLTQEYYKVAFSYSDLVMLWKNTPMTDCATRQKKPDWSIDPVAQM